MNFGILMTKNFANPAATYEFTRAKFIRTINQYVAGGFAKNLAVSQFGLIGKVQFPSRSPMPYMTSPSRGVMGGRVISYKAGRVNNGDYDSVAKASRGEIGSFWPKFFELIGKAFMRSSFVITPVTDYFMPPIAQYSTPLTVTFSYLSRGESYYNREGQVFSSGKFLREWRKAGAAFQSEILALKIDDPARLRTLLGKAVKAVASKTFKLYIKYRGTIKFGNENQPCLFDGLIYGKMKFD